MKKLIVVMLILVVAVSSIFTSGVVTAFAQSRHDGCFDLQISHDYIYQKERYVFLGNMRGASKAMVDDYLDKHYVVVCYDYSGVEIEHTEPICVATMHYKFDGINYTRQLFTNETRYGELENDITESTIAFYEDVMRADYSASVVLKQNTNAVQLNCYASAEYHFKPYGKVCYQSNFYRTTNTDGYNDYLVESQYKFIPGSEEKILNNEMQRGRDLTFAPYSCYEATVTSQAKSRTKTFFGGGSYHGEEAEITDYAPKNQFTEEKLYPYLNSQMLSSDKRIAGWQLKDFAENKNIAHTLDTSVVVRMDNGMYNGEFEIDNKIVFVLSKSIFNKVTIEINPCLYVYGFNVN